jgi:proline iminopeptidase
MKSSEGFAFVRPGLHLYYRVLDDRRGDGRDDLSETVVVPNANWLWEALQPLAEKRRLILYDPRSRGRSSTVTDPRHLGLNEDVEDLEALRRYFSLDRMALLGSSYHAAITALYAAANPDRVTRMLLVCPITPRRPGEWLQELPTSDFLIHPPGMPRLEELQKDGTEQADPAAYCRAWFTHFLLPAQMGEPAAVARFPVADVCAFPNEWPRHAIPLYLDHIFPAMGTWDFRPSLAALHRPVLVIQGTDDLIPLEASREWAAALPEARFLALEGAGHHPYLETPKEFYPAAEAFLAGGWPPGAE